MRIFKKHFHFKEHRKHWRTAQTACRFDHLIARKSRLESLVTSQLIRTGYELWRHRQLRQFSRDRMIVWMCGLRGSSLFSVLFLMTVFVTVFKISCSSPFWCLGYSVFTRSFMNVVATPKMFGVYTIRFFFLIDWKFPVTFFFCNFSPFWVLCGRVSCV